MKKLNSLLVLFFIAATVYAQEGSMRPYTADEMKRWATVCDWLGNAIPKTYKDWKVEKCNCGSFEWAETKNDKPLTIVDKNNKPTGNNPNYAFHFLNESDSAKMQSQLVESEIMTAQKPDGTYDVEKFNRISAKLDKFTQCNRIKIYAGVNYKVELEEQYHISTSPVKIDLPVTAFAYMYTFPLGKPLFNERGELMNSNKEFYKDKALIIISTKMPKVIATPIDGKSSYREDRIILQDSKLEIMTIPVKNIVVEITGNEKDIKEIIKQTDWKALQALLGK